MAIDKEFLDECLDYRATPEEIALQQERQNVAAASLREVAAECVGRVFLEWFPACFPRGHMRDSLLFDRTTFTCYVLYDVVTFIPDRGLGYYEFVLTQLVMDYIAKLPRGIRTATVPVFTLERNAFMWRLVLTGQIESDIVRVDDDAQPL